MLRFLPLCLLLLPLACQTLSAESITPDVVRTTDGHGGFVRLEVTGSRDVPTDPLTQALHSCITASGLFQGIADAGQDWVLSATVIAFDEPEWGLDITASVLVLWQLTDASGAGYWTERILTEETATPEDAFALGEREDLAITGAVRANLAQALERLASLDLER